MAEHLHTKGAPAIKGIFSHGVKIPATASLVFCSGQVPSHGDGLEEGLAGTTIEDKTEIVLRNLEKVLKDGGSSLAQLVKVNVYLRDWDYMEPMNSVYTRLVPEPKPARTCITVKDLPLHAELEIEAVGWAN